MKCLKNCPQIDLTLRYTVEVRLEVEGNDTGEQWIVSQEEKDI